jgi:hypothetical protein
VGATKIWYYPTTSNRAAVVDFDRIITTRIGPRPVLRTATAESLTGSLVTTSYGLTSSIRLQHTWDTRGNGRALRRKLYNLWNHLQRGGTCLVAEDATYAFAAFLSPLPSRRASVLNYSTNLLGPLAGATNIDDREVVVQSDPDTAYTEMGLVSDHAALPKTVTLSTSVLFPYAHAARWAMVRELGTYPCLRLPESERNADPLTHDHEQVFHLDLALEEDPDGLDALQTTPLGGDDTVVTEGPNLPPDTTVAFDPPWDGPGAGGPRGGGRPPLHGWEW